MRRRLALASAAVLGLGATSALTGVTIAPAWADDQDCINVRADDTGQTDTELSSPPYAQLDIGQAQKVVRHHAPPERPVRVAVLDSGVYGAVGVNDQLTVHARTTVTGSSELTDYHGTAVAGLIAGHDRASGKPVGFAPDAEIVDVRVYDVQDSSSEGGKEVSGSALVEGLDWVAKHAGDMNIRVANVSLVVRRSGQLTSAIKKVREAGVIVVAASGNRPQDESAEFYNDFATTEELDTDKFRSEDAAKILYPAGYGDVITVNSTLDGAEGNNLAAYVVKNSRTDVAVPTNGAVTYGINGKTCFLQPPATSWAAAEVSGVLALLWERYPHETDEQIIARLLTTASGTMDDPTPYTGVGVVQPLEALTRPLGPAGTDEAHPMTTQQDVEVRAVAPEPEPDPLAGIRDDAVWWGLIGGGTLVVALLLRPVLARRRT